MRKTRRIGMLAGVMLSLVLSAGAATFYVDVNYDQSNGASDGSATAPYTNITAAVSDANETTSQDTILVAGGIYQSVLVGGYEDFGDIGIEYIAQNGLVLKGGFVGQVDGATFDWTEETRVPRSTIIDLDGAGTRAFYGTRSITVEGFTFRNADHTLHGGVIRKDAGYLTVITVRDCLFTNNVTTAEGGAIYALQNAGTSTYEDSDFIDNRASQGGAIRGQGTSVSRCNFRGNHASTTGWAGGAILAEPILIEDSTFSNNTTPGYGGALFARGTARRSIFKNNSSGLGGSVFHAGGNAQRTMLFENCLMVANSGVHTLFYGTSNAGSLTVYHCTLVNNTNSTACISVETHHLSVTNTIIASNGPRGIRRTGSSTADVDFNLVWGHSTADYDGLTAGDNDISEEPVFEDADDGDFRLTWKSPGINAGMDLGIVEDLAGNARPFNEKDPGIDIGCFETEPPPQGTMILMR